MKWIVTLLKVEEYDIWNRFVGEHPGGTIFHKTSWLSLINSQVEIFVIRMDHNILAGVALIKTSKNGVSGYHIPPYTQYFGPLYNNPDRKNSSLTEEHECISLLLETIHAKHVDFRLARGHQSVLPYYWKGFETSVAITHTIAETKQEYLKCLNKNKIRELNKLLLMKESGELIVDAAISEMELSHLLQQTSVRKGFNANTKLVLSFVTRSDASFAKKIVIRSRQHGLIAFGFFPFDQRGVYNIINASVRISDPVLKTINLLLLYEAIEFALDNGKIFDFEGSMLPGVEAFCRLMGGKPVPVYRVQKSSSLQYSLLRAAHQIKNDWKT
ncbi:MAG: hypothetical protein ABIO04_01960 [Ferruginibacter sp.]